MPAAQRSRRPEPSFPAGRDTELPPPPRSGSPGAAPGEGEEEEEAEEGGRRCRLPASAGGGCGGARARPAGRGRGRGATGAPYAPPAVGPWTPLIPDFETFPPPRPPRACQGKVIPVCARGSPAMVLLKSCGEHLTGVPASWDSPATVVRLRSYGKVGNISPVLRSRLAGVCTQRASILPPYPIPPTCQAASFLPQQYILKAFDLQSFKSANWDHRHVILFLWLSPLGE